uniref:Uncharacterized protein n=1 Tax=Euplotes crassus TaxID=5936 RepID=A0A7S3KLV6_EUPCR|mmetsp:Transcript_32208/g.31623  ORF Transcript_32208/g.31623 Transcript_32208/m.31623 type:complete len:538 (+) Transcript_32208:130-1743(+)
MRMRQPLNEALKWYREKNNLNTIQRSKKVTQQYLSTKVISINVVGCEDLVSRNNRNQKRMRPFFHYIFYKFDEVFSKTYEGQNPEMNEIKTFTTEVDNKFKNYTEEKRFEIHVFDDSIKPSVHDEDNSIDDMIGVAYIPLFEVAQGNNLYDKFAIKDYNGNVNGMMEVKITLHNSLEDINAPFAQSVQYKNNDWTSEFLFKVCLRYAAKPNMDLNNLYAIFSKGENDISRRNFRDTIVPRKSGVTESEIESFIKECEPFQRRGYMTKEQFLQIMKGPFRRATNENRIRQKELRGRRDSEDDSEDDFRRATEKSRRETKPESHRTGRSHKSDRSHKSSRRDRRDEKEEKKDSKPQLELKEEEIEKIKRYNQEDLERIKNKIRDFVINEEVSLKGVYEFIDKDGDNRLDLAEFTTKIKNVKIDVTDIEAKALFYYVDANESGEITYKEFSTALHDIHMECIFQKIRKIVKGIGSNLDKLFSEMDSKDKGYWNKEDYKEFVDMYCDSLKKYEVDDLLAHLDRNGDNRIDKGELGRALDLS